MGIDKPVKVTTVRSVVSATPCSAALKVGTSQWDCGKSTDYARDCAERLRMNRKEHHSVSVYSRIWNCKVRSKYCHNPSIRFFYRFIIQFVCLGLQLLFGAHLYYVVIRKLYRFPKVKPGSMCVFSILSSYLQCYRGLSLPIYTCYSACNLFLSFTRFNRHVDYYIYIGAQYGIREGVGRLYRDRTGKGDYI